MESVKVNLKRKEDNSYEIIIGNNILNDIPSELTKRGLAHSYVIITDSNVSTVYGNKLLASFRRAKLNTHLISFPAGEKNKNRGTKVLIENEMMKLRLSRDTAVIALGGGVVGDVAGFVAATYNRGIPYIQIPTTLVACVDSSIGGKTGVDTPYGKNLIGSFHQPSRVYIDVQTLFTLEKKEVRQGLAEVIKYGVIKDEKFFRYLENYIYQVFAFNFEILVQIIKKCCRIKGKIVEIDERESNLRKILNFGHTIGHAIEQLYNYKISHGEAISIGMILEGKIALKIGLWKLDEFERLNILLKKAGLPTLLPSRINVKRLINIMRLDKKTRGGIIEMVLPRRIGEMSEINGKYGIKVDERLITSLFGNV